MDSKGYFELLQKSIRKNFSGEKQPHGATLPSNTATWSKSKNPIRYCVAGLTL